MGSDWDGRSRRRRGGMARSLATASSIVRSSFAKHTRTLGATWPNAPIGMVAMPWSRVQRIAKSRSDSPGNKWFATFKTWKYPPSAGCQVNAVSSRP